MKAIITCPFIPIANRVGSHRGAQGVIYADMIKQTGVDIEVNYGGKIEDHNQYDAMYVYHGNDWAGGLNLFGGMTAFPYAFNTRNFSQFKGKVYSIGIDFPPYHEMIQDRLDKGKGKAIQQEWLDVDLVNLKRMHEEAETIDLISSSDKLVIGDSHAISLYRPGWLVNSVPFKTLNGALNRGLDQFVADIKPIEEINNLDIYFGNIDIRHHLCRLEGDSIELTTELAKRYLDHAESLSVDNVSLYELLPIEDESRKVPKSGHYKGQAFWGSREERNECRLAFKEYLESNCDKCQIVSWVNKLQNGEGQLDFKCMEKPRSIHLSREYYPYWTGLEQDNTINTLF